MRGQEGVSRSGMPEGVLDVAAGLVQGRSGLTRFRLATGFFQRVRGLLGTKASKEILLLAPCKDIHTVGMRYAIDVAFIDQSGTVVLACRDVGPGKRIACKEAAAVLERSADGQSAWYECGDVLLMGCAPNAGGEATSAADGSCSPVMGRSCVPDARDAFDEAEGEANGKRGVVQ